MIWQTTDYNITVVHDQNQMPTFDVGSEWQPLVFYQAYVIIKYVILSISIVASTLGIFTNIFNIIIFMAMGVEDGVTTLFLGMAWSDLIYVTLNFICNAVDFLYVMETEQMLWLTINPKGMVFYSDNATIVVQVTTALTSTFLAVARCMCVVRPLHFKNMFTKIRSLIALAVCFLFALACQAAVFSKMGMAEKFHESRNASRIELWFAADRETVKNIVRLLLSCIVPLGTQAIIVVCVVVMIAKLREASNFRNLQAVEDSDKGSHSNKLTGRDRQVAVQVILICIIYIITNIPKICSSIYSMVEPQFTASKAFKHFYEISSATQNLFETINASVNFFIYFKFSKSFRSACFLRKTKSS